MIVASGGKVSDALPFLRRHRAQIANATTAIL